MVVGWFVRDPVDNAVSTWLYGGWNERKYRTYQALNTIPGVHEYFDYLLDKRADEEYLRRYGMSYDDIHDPRKLRQTSSSATAVRTAYHMVSRNVDDLYRDRSVKKRSSYSYGGFASPKHFLGGYRR